VLKPAETASDSACMATPGRLDAVFDLSRKLASCLDLDDVLREVGLCASALTGAHAVTLERYDRKARALVAFGSGIPAAGADADADVARRVLKTHDLDAVEGQEGSTLVAALVSRGESVGVMRIRTTSGTSSPGTRLSSSGPSPTWSRARSRMRSSTPV
jgi:hypothetical protein